MLCASGCGDDQALLTAQAQPPPGDEPVQATVLWYLPCKQLLLPVGFFAERTQWQHRQLSVLPQTLVVARCTSLKLATRLHLPCWFKMVLHPESYN